MFIDHIILLIFVILSVFSKVSAFSSSSSLAINFNYVLTIPWDSSSCQNNLKNSKPTPNCCQTLTSLYGIAIARYLNQTSLFRLQNLQTSVSCLSDFQTKLTRLNLPENLASSCFDPQRFINTTNVCANIQTKQDWIDLLGKSTYLDNACNKDLTDLTACDACVHAGFRVQSELLVIDGDNSRSKGCFYYTILYAAGVVNELGPESDGSLSCIFGLPLILQKSQSKRALVFGSVGAGIGIVVLISLFSYWLIWRFSTKDQIFFEGFSSLEPGFEYDGLLSWRPKGDTLKYKIEELQKATDKFSAKNLIGKGQFGNVYKGKLQDGTIVAVKRVIDQDFQGDDDFFSREVEIISTLKHRNLVPLRGFCEKYLVYDYMPNGSLDDHLYQVHRRKLTWPKRKNIILDVANALVYLHYGVNPPIYHRDIKPTNILLDSSMRARVADFGLATRAKDGESQLTTRIAGTHGYLAPEYALYGQLTEKSDVYSFGIVVLETMCGRKGLDLSSSSAFLITDWVWEHVKDGKLEQVLDPFLVGEYGEENRIRCVKRFVMVGILCAHLMVALRPTMLEALRMLEGDIEVPTIPDRPLCYGK
ncbi:hypothetical protein CASFOL_035764 [Castilleja foliolosa]|uniref:non-specific serine/threonine protein kinase n=1 Tax=Castilleja foliolosa TaxID=1961234 RepID=A0ABD3BVX9_9LAMI